VIAAFHAECPDVGLSTLCTTLGISRSWFYERTTADEPTEDEVALRDAIERIVLTFPGYGYRRVTAQLRRDGWTGERAVNHKRVLRILREECLLCRLQTCCAASRSDSSSRRIVIIPTAPIQTCSRASNCLD
jgi:putative transposase